MPETNSGCARKCGDCVECLSPLPYGASCASSCAHIARCKALFGQKGSEGACQFVPSRFTPNVHLQTLPIPPATDDYGAADGIIVEVAA